MKKNVVKIVSFVIVTVTFMAFTNGFRSSRENNLMLSLLLDNNVEALSGGECQIYLDGKAMCTKAPGKICGFRYNGGNWYCQDMQLISKK